MGWSHSQPWFLGVQSSTVASKLIDPKVKLPCDSLVYTQPSLGSRHFIPPSLTLKFKVFGPLSYH